MPTRRRTKDEGRHITDLLLIKERPQNPTIILLGSSTGTTCALFTWRMVFCGASRFVVLGHLDRLSKWIT